MRSLKKRSGLIYVIAIAILSGIATLVWLQLSEDFGRTKPYWQEFCIENSADENAFKVLFVGNSLLFCSSVPHQFAEIYKQLAGRPLKVWQVVAPGETLIGHLRKGNVEKVLRTKGPWDVVIFQGATIEIKYPQSIEYGARQLVVMARKYGARPYLFMPWSRRDQGVQKRISKLYTRLGEELQLTVIPDGDLLFLAQRRFPNFGFFGKDNYHPSALGSYFAALLTYLVLTDEMPEGVFKNIQSPNGRVHARISDSEYAACRELLEKYRAENPASSR